MFGDIVYSRPGYTELLLAWIDTTRLVACLERETIKLYRVEWTEDNGSYNRNEVAYDLPLAIALFYEKCGIDICVLCRNGIAKGAPRLINTYPEPAGVMHEYCFNSHIEQCARDQRNEMEAERRNEEALYKYELPRE